jgi:hypothetical protein
LGIRSGAIPSFQQPPQRAVDQLLLIELAIGQRIEPRLSIWIERPVYISEISPADKASSAIPVNKDRAAENNRLNGSNTPVSDKAMSASKIGLERSLAFLVPDNEWPVRDARQCIDRVRYPFLSLMKFRVGARWSSDHNMLPIALPRQYIRAKTAPAILGVSLDPL